MELNTQEVHLSHYWNVIYKRWRVAVAIIVVVMLGTFLASELSTPLYRSSIQIQIERENVNQVTIDDLFGIEASDQEFLQTQYILLKSRGLAARVIDDGRLLSDADFYPSGIAGKTSAEVAQIRDSQIARLIAGIEVTPVRNTSLVEIAYIAPTPRLAQKVAETIGSSYIRMKIEQKLESVHQASDFLSKQIAQVKGELATVRAELQRYAESKDIISVNDSGNVTNQKLTQLNTEVTAAQKERIDREAQYQTIVRASPESVAANDPVVQKLTEDEARLKREYEGKLAQFRPEYPAMQRLKSDLDKAHQARQNALANAYAQIRDAARNEMLSAQSRAASMNSAFSQQKGEAQKLNTNAAIFTDLQSEIASKQAFLDRLSKQQSETEVSARLRGSNTANIHWVDHALLPAARFNVTMKKNMQSAFPLAIILGLGAIFFLEYMDRSIKTPEELERVTGFASLGVIPAASSLNKTHAYGSESGPKIRAVESPAEEKRNIDLLPYHDSRSPIAEAYRAFRTSLLLASANSPKVIAITSTFAREGKTTTAVNLATVLAQMGKPVLLMDADLRRPRLQKVFRGKMNVGLVNYLAANTPLSDVIQETVVPNLSVVLSGPTPPNPSELLSSDRMKHLIHELRARFAFVIFDTPPVLAVTDSIVLAASADGVVLCVHGGQTPRDLVQRSAERLRQSKIPVLGAILNNLDLQQYGYTYKKNYYDYYDSELPPRAVEGARKASEPSGG